jgi:hypothetical protein
MFLSSVSFLSFRSLFFCSRFRRSFSLGGRRVRFSSPSLPMMISLHALMLSRHGVIFRHRRPPSFHHIRDCPPPLILMPPSISFFFASFSAVFLHYAAASFHSPLISDTAIDAFEQHFSSPLIIDYRSLR